MRRTLWILLTLVACGDDAPVMVDAPIMQNADAPLCQPLSAVGSFYRRTPNPRFVAGGHTYAGNALDTTLTDPDLMWDGSSWQLYWTARPGSFGAGGAPVIRHATSTDLASWTFDTSASAPSGMQPSVLRLANGHFLMATATLQGDIQIFTTSGTSPNLDQFTLLNPGAVTPFVAYPNAPGAKLSEPEIVFAGGTYHMWFSSNDGGTKKGIGHATSVDAGQWTLDTPSVPTLLRASSDPTTGGTSPAVIYDEAHCRWEMWIANDSPATDNDNQPTEDFNMVGVYHATSTNGTSWTISYSQIRDLVWDATAAGEHLGMRAGADVAIKGGGRYLVYTGYDDQNVPSGSTLPTRTGTTSGVMTLNLATRDAPP